MRWTKLLGLGLIGIVNSIWGAAAGANVTLTTVAYTDEAAPGTSGQFEISPDFYPSIDNTGQISFEAGSGNTDSSTDGIWAGTPGAFSLVAFPGLVSNGNNGQSYNSIIGIDVEQLGPLAYDARLNETGGGLLFGTWIHESNGTELQVANPDILVPGFPGGSFQSFAPDIAVNPNGQYVFWNSLSTDSDEAGGIWANLNGSLQLIEHSGQQAPGFASGVTWEPLVTRPQMDVNGQAVFFGALSNNQTGIFTFNGTSITPIAVSGESVPGNPGKTFGQLSNVQPLPDNDGDLAFTDQSNKMWLLNSTGYHFIAGPGTAIMGGGTFSSVSSDPSAADNGSVVFYGEQSNGVDGLYRYTASGIQVIARTGMQAPGEPAGTTFYSISSPDVNDVGQAAFTATLESATENVTFNTAHDLTPRD